jgi:glycosyltransferase involved in cell wall biosynthesis
MDFSRKNSDGLISVIIPVYNVEEYLRKCLDSVVAQTHKNLEIICINDGSPDNCDAILDEYKKMDDRIRVIAFGENRGVAEARNTGLENAAGEYTGFVDPDDWLDNDFYEKLYEKAKETGAEITKGEIKMYFGEFGEQVFETNSNGIIRQKGKHYFSYGIPSALYKTEFIKKNGINFPAGITNGEDGVFLTKALVLAGRLELEDSVRYHYLKREGSAHSQIYDRAKTANILKATGLMVSFYNSLDEKVLSIKEYCTLFDVLKDSFSHFYERTDCKDLFLDGILDICKMCKYKEYYFENNIMKNPLRESPNGA